MSEAQRTTRRGRGHEPPPRTRACPSSLRATTDARDGASRQAAPAQHHHRRLRRHGGGHRRHHPAGGQPLRVGQGQEQRARDVTDAECRADGVDEPDAATGRTDQVRQDQAQPAGQGPADDPRSDRQGADHARRQGREGGPRSRRAQGRHRVRPLHRCLVQRRQHLRRVVQARQPGLPGEAARHGAGHRRMEQGPHRHKTGGRSRAGDPRKPRLRRDRTAADQTQRDAHLPRHRQIRAGVIRRTAVPALMLPAVIAVAGCGSSSSGGEGSPAVLTPSSSAPARAGGSGGCTAPSSTAPQKQHYASEPKVTIEPTTYTATIATNCGTITVALDGKAAPHTVNSFAFLAGKHYFDNTKCHRLTTSGIFVLQCGDPTGTGGGTPGYEFRDENLSGATYPAGTVAMANAGPGTNGSQFFFVYADTPLPPAYTPFGKVTSGLDILKAVAAKGSNPPGDGAPKQPVTITSFTVAKG